MTASILNPPFDSELRRSPLLVATFNLVATIVGGGVLSLPLAFEKCGIVGATILMIFAATITAKSLLLLCSTARKTGATSFGGVGKDAFGAWMDTSISVLLFVFLLFVLVAYMVLLRDIWTPLVQLRLPGISGNSVLFGIIILMSPCLVQRTLHALRFNCYVGFGSVSVLCVALLHHAAMTIIMTTMTPSTTTATTPMHLKYFPESFADALFAFPIITLSFLSAFNVLPIQNALIRPTPERMRSVVQGAVTCCFVLLYCLGLGGYLYAQDETKGNILLNCNHDTNDGEEDDDDDVMFMVGRVGCGITIMLALGMMMLPCRDSLLEAVDLVILMTRSSSSSSTSLRSAAVLVSHTDAAGENTALLGNNDVNNNNNTTIISQNDHQQQQQELRASSSSIRDNVLVHYASTVGIALTTYLGAVVAPGVAIVWSLCGSSMAFIISFLLPAACYLQLEHRLPDLSIGHAGQRITSRVLFSWFLVVFSVLGAILCTRQTVMMKDSNESEHHPLDF